MTDEGFKALVNDARQHCNSVDNRQRQYGHGGLTTLLGLILYIAENEAPDSRRGIAAREWIETMAMKWRNRNE